MKEPKLRFPEFVDDWKPYKVSEITNFHKQGFYTTEDYCNDKKYYLLRGTDLSNNRLQLNDTPKINATEKDYQAFKVKTGDFLVVRSGTVGTYGIVYQEIPAIFGSYLINFRFDHSKVKNEFFGYFYQSDLFKRQLNKIIQQSANTNINAENIKSTIIQLPSLNEQQKIASLFTELDNLIQSAEKELEGYRELKQCMLQKMFPKKGKTVPEVRFPEFTGDWEEHELSEMFNYEQPSKYIVKNDDYEGCSKYPVLTANKGFILGYTDETEGIYDKGEVIIFDDFTCDHKFVNFPFKIKSSAIKFLTPKDNYNLSFLSELLNVMNQQPLSHQRHWISVMQPSIALTPSLEEQKKIGEYFSNLDNLIALQQKELDGYKELKKGLLQQMFC